MASDGRKRNEYFSNSDREWLRLRGMDENRLLDQIELFEQDCAFLTVERPCRVGDGIVHIEEEAIPSYVDRFERAASSGRFCKFVPASGAATRMFKCLYQALETSEQVLRDAVRSPEGEGFGDYREFVRFVNNYSKFAFADDWQRCLGRPLDEEISNGNYHDILRSLLSPDGLGLGSLPKALVPFHRYPSGARSAFEEHLVEGAGYVRDAAGGCRLHFTTSDHHEQRILNHFDMVRSGYEDRYDCRYEISLSQQKPSTDTLAVDMENRLLRDDSGRLVLRPGGHGAVLGNLNDLQGDLVFIKNVDNVVPDHLKETTVLWKKVLGGLLVELQSLSHRFIADLHVAVTEDIVERAFDFVRSRLGLPLPEERGDWSLDTRAEYVLDRLDRPLRVCGMVRNVGEPGGGPFWVRGRDGGLSPQVVEKAQIRFDDEQQTAIWNESTHFNPVDLVCAVRDHQGHHYDLQRFVDPNAVFITRKFKAGRALKALELPGLWNGSMAHWNTVFVEVPEITFNPVKTVLDLLRREHQPRSG